jgi:hypothetical protein
MPITKRAISGLLMGLLTGAAVTTLDSARAGAATDRGEGEPVPGGKLQAPADLQPPPIGGAISAGGLNARAFGARGDGRTDDTGALQRFFDAVVAAGEQGYIPAGTYRTTAALRIGSPALLQRSRGFSIRGAGRTGVNGSRAIGGTLIVCDAPGQIEAVVEWEGSAWRDSWFGDLGLASMTPDGARYGLLIRSSEISHLTFNNIGVENVRTAFGLLSGSGFNGEFCTWSHIQTFNVLNYFYSDAGQAYGLRFSDTFCYYRPGGVIFELNLAINGGGLHLTNFDASPVVLPRNGSPKQRADTTLFKFTGLPNAPVTVVGGRFEHITTIVVLNATATDIVIHSNIQFIGTDFTTDLDREGFSGGLATINLHRQALADVNFLNCMFATSLPRNGEELVRIRADLGCRGNIQFTQCGFWGYAEEPGYDGSASPRLQVSWSDCTANVVSSAAVCRPADSDFSCRSSGGAFDKRINARTGTNPVRVSASTGRMELFDGETWHEMPRTLVADRAPTSGRYLPGDMCRNGAPTPGSPLEWLCIAGGEPGEWIAVSHLSAAHL